MSDSCPFSDPSAATTPDTAVNRHLLLAAVKSGPPEACLPCRLSDGLLDLLARDLDWLLSAEGFASEDSKPLVAPMAMILRLLAAQHHGEPFEVPEEALVPLFEDLRAEVALEGFRRRTGAPIRPATVETIFQTRRDWGDV